MRGYYFCENCNILIRVYTKTMNSSHGKVEVKLDKCPHCQNDILIESSYEDFFSTAFKLWLSVLRYYSFTRTGKRLIKMGIKYI